MSTIYKAFGGQKIDVLPHVQRAITLSGKANPESAPRIAKMLAKLMDDGHAAEKIAKAERADEGSMRFVIERAILWTFDEADRRQRHDPDVKKIYTLARFHAGVGACGEAMALDGHCFEFGTEPIVPLPDCRRETCPCSIGSERRR